ncbi:MAG: DUF2520 domain-containing protein [Ruaniaceae bacterium]|nr:DUF2520 domain-containing protein [Ruaniaceae bacterium]
MKGGVIGAGRVGAVLGHALRRSGHEIVGVTAVSDASIERAETLLPGAPILAADEILPLSQIVLLAVPDDAIAPLVSGLAALDLWSRDHAVVHTSGAHGVEVLEPARAAGAITIAIHPAMTFTGTSMDVPRLDGLPFAVTAHGVHATIGDGLVIDMGGEPFRVKSADRALYHAALAHGSNHMLVLVNQARRMLASAGIDPHVIGPLLQATLDGALTGEDSRVTGPVVRGDVGTITAHLQALDEAGLPDADETYRALAAATAHYCAERGLLRREKAAEILTLLEKP